MRFRLAYRFRPAAFGAAVVALALAVTATAGGGGGRQRSRRVQDHYGRTPSGSPARAVRENAVAPGGNCYRLPDGPKLEPTALIKPLVAP
jgi:hypothetical protein